MNETQLKQTIAIVTAIEVTLDSVGVKPGSKQFNEAKNLFAKTMGETLGRIEIDQITKEVASTKPYKKRG